MSDLNDLAIESVADHGTPLEKAMASEIQRRRSEQAAGREHIERVVREEIEYDASTHGIARRVADRLSVPVLSEEDRERLSYLVGWCNAGLGDVTLERPRLDYAIAALHRLIAAGKP